MQPADDLLHGSAGVAERGDVGPWAIKPWVPAPPDIVVYEYGARLDAASQAAACEQIVASRALYNDLVAFIRGVHAEMNAWVLTQAGSEAQGLDAQLRTCEAELAMARAAGDGDALRRLAPQRLDLGKRLTGLLRPVRAQHRETLRREFFARIGRTTATQTYRLRCASVDNGLGWATANAVLDSALLAWNRALANGRAPQPSDPDQRDQDSLYLQFPTKGGLPVQRLVNGSSLEIHLELPAAARRRAYGAFRFRLGLARDDVDANGTWQCHRPLPEGSRVVLARLVRRRIADRDRWFIQLVLRLAEPIRLERHAEAELAAVHFGWMKIDGGRRVATIARCADAGAARDIVLPGSVEEDLDRAAELNAQRATKRQEIVGKLVTIDWPSKKLSAIAAREVEALRNEPAEKVAARQIYRLRDQLSACGFRLDWLDAWVAEDRRRWQGALLTARRARGRRRDFYRCIALELARRHDAVALEPLDLKAASRATVFGGDWSGFSRHARAGRAVAALHEFDQAIRWACARHGTPVFDVSGPTTRTCATCSRDELVTQIGGGARLLCRYCGVDIEKSSNAAAISWQRVQSGLADRMVSHCKLVASKCNALAEAQVSRLAALAESRRRLALGLKPK